MPCSRTRVPSTTNVPVSTTTGTPRTGPAAGACERCNDTGCADGGVPPPASVAEVGTGAVAGPGEGGGAVVAAGAGGGGGTGAGTAGKAGAGAGVRGAAAAV